MLTVDWVEVAERLAREAERDAYWALFEDLDVRPLLADALRPLVYEEFLQQMIASAGVPARVYRGEPSAALEG